MAGKADCKLYSKEKLQHRSEPDDDDDDNNIISWCLNSIFNKRLRAWLLEMSPGCREFRKARISGVSM